MHARTLLLASLLGVGPVAAGATPPSREPAPALEMLALGGGVQVLVGTQSVGGHPMQAPIFEWHAAQARDGAWSPLRPLAPAAIGHPVPLRESPWRLETAGLSPGQLPHHRLLPLTGELGLVGGRLEALEKAEIVRVASIDDWTIVVVEQAPGNVMLVRRITAEGSSLELDVAEKFAWRPDWPEDTRLASLNAGAAWIMAWGREPSGTMHAAALPERPIPPLRLAPGSLASGLHVEAQPAIVALEDGTLRVHRLGPDGWVAGDAIAWPEGKSAAALAARASGTQPGDIVVAVAEDARGRVDRDGDAPGVRVATLASGSAGWTSAQRLDAADSAPPLLPPLPHGEKAPSLPGSGAPVTHRAVLAIAALASAAALAVAITQFRALRQRRRRSDGDGDGDRGAY